MKKNDKKTLLSMVLVSLFSAGSAHADITVERLSLFLDDGTSIYENRQLVDSTNSFPPELTVNFEENEFNGEKTWQWTITNHSTKPLVNVKLMGLIDVDISAKDNTFFNEIGQLISLSAPKGYIPASHWEIGEPGYYDGQLIANLIKKTLSNTSHLDSRSNADDVAIALSLPLPKLGKNETFTVIATLNHDQTKGTVQNDHESAVNRYFNFYGKKDDKFMAMPFNGQGGLLTTGSAIKDGNVWVWGFRGSSQQGNGVMVVPSYATPAKVQSLKNITSITGGAYHLLALDENGDVYGWGQSGYGETGCAPTQGIYVSTPCKVLNNVVQIGAGEYFSMALDERGTVWTWGHNLYGQLGNNGNKNSQTPIALNLNGEKARLIGGAYEGGFAVTEEGHVWAWGDNEASGLGFQGTNYGVQKIIRTPTRAPNLDKYADSMTYIAGGNGWGEALLDDGTVIGWGLHASLGQGTTKTNISSPNPVVIMQNVKQLYARYVGSIALTEEGGVYTWGQTGGSAFKMIYGESPTLRIKDPNIVAIGGGKEHIFYELENGNMYGVGYNDLYKIDQSKCCAPNVNWPGKMLTIDK